VAVLSNNDGCIIARSNEVKALGVPMGIPLFKCRDVIAKNNVKLFSSNFTLYGDISARVMSTLKEMAQNIEIYSVDEAFLDVSSIKDKYEYGVKIRDTIKQNVGIPVSVGIGQTKTLAKAANELAKKHEEFESVLEITPKNRNKMLAMLPIDGIWGVGRRYSKKLNSFGIHTALELIKKPDRWIQKHMTITGLKTILELRGIPCISMRLTEDSRKGILSSRSFGRPVTEIADLKQAVASYVSIAARKLRSQGSLATNIGVFLRTGKKDPGTHYKIPLEVPTSFTPNLIKHAHHCLEEIYKPDQKYKKAGVYLSRLVPENYRQLNMFIEKDDAKESRISNLVDQVNNYWGKDFIRFAATGTKRRWKMKSEQKSPRYTTNWNELLTIKI